MKNIKVKVGGKSLTLRSFLWGDFVRLEDEYGVDMKKITTGFSAKELNSIYFVALKNADPDIAPEALNALDLNHAIFQPEVLPFLFGSQTIKEDAKQKNG